MVAPFSAVLRQAHLVNDPDFALMGWEELYPSTAAILERTTDKFDLPLSVRYEEIFDAAKLYLGISSGDVAVELFELSAYEHTTDVVEQVAFDLLARWYLRDFSRDEWSALWFNKEPTLGYPTWFWQMIIASFKKANEFVAYMPHVPTDVFNDYMDRMVAVLQPAYLCAPHIRIQFDEKRAERTDEWGSLLSAHFWTIFLG
jgi:hypothetical protein